MSSTSPSPRDEEIFSEAAELPLTERAAYLDRTCAGDPDLLARVQRLLASHDRLGGFLEVPLTPRLETTPEEKPGDVIGRYTLVRPLGEGGCGIVYLAEQTRPVRRQVALKVIKLGMDTRQVIARFEAERQALALMNHPGIAAVLDAGTTDAGRPYFVMELVEGVPITRFCDERSLPLAERLELFTHVCLAIQHAHQKGIVHRDVKPSNILVTVPDGVPKPKVIDFGIAKATQEKLTEHTMVTRVDQFMGTPAYMSPEQAGMTSDDIDTRSDIYSLGVVLYELLTGGPAFDPATLSRTGLAEIRRAIVEVDPPRPSARILALADADRTVVARHRGVGAARLTATLRGDLDWIVMRCLEKERSRRYDTAQALADDLRRHLRQEPVLARPPEFSYRVRKFVARNRLACASAAAIAAALIAGTVISVRQAIRATRAERIATAERDAATAAQHAEALARGDAQRRQEQAEDVLSFLIGDFRTELKKVGRLELLDAVGDKALAYYDSLDARDVTDGGLARQAKALTQIGEVRLDQARYADAERAFRSAYERAAALAARHPADADPLFERAQAEFWIGFTARRRGDAATEREWLVRYRDSALALAAIDPDQLRAQREVTSGHHNLAVLESDRGNLAAARAGLLAERTAIEAMLALRPDDDALQFRLADVASWLGTVAERAGDFAEALAAFTEMTSRTEALATREPGNTRWQLKRAEGLTFAGNILAITGDRAAAGARFERAQSLYDTLVARDPANRQWQLFAQNIRHLRAALLMAQGDRGAARPLVAAVRAALETLQAAEPTSRAFTRHLATAWQLEARLRLPDGADAPAAAARAIALGESLLSGETADLRATCDLARSLILAGRIAQAQQQPDAAHAHWTRALELLGPKLPGSNDWRLLDPATQAYSLLGQHANARPLIERLRQLGYQPLDPFAASLLETAP